MEFLHAMVYYSIMNHHDDEINVVGKGPSAVYIENAVGISLNYIIILFNYNMSYQLEEKGYTSKTICLPHLFIKYIINFKKYDVYHREKHIGSILNQFDWYPKLLYCDDTNQILIFSNVGIPLTTCNKPKNIKEQFDNILKDMESVSVKHNDIKQGELLINKSGKIFLCDFGWGTVNNELGCGINIFNGKKPSGNHNDKDALLRLKLI